MKRIAQQSALILLLLSLNTVYGDEINQTCEVALRNGISQSQQLHTNAQTCLNSKITDLGNYQTKRQEYLRIVNWAEFFNNLLGNNEYLQAIKERDFLLTSKLEHYETCVVELKHVHLPNVSPPANLACHDAQEQNNKTIKTLKSFETECRNCSLSTIGEGYQNSAAQILEMQDNDSRALRNALYETVSQADDVATTLSRQQKWQFLRDVVIQHVEDTADELNESSAIVELLEWLDDSTDDQKNFNIATDRAISVYEAISQLLQSSPSKAESRASVLKKRLLELTAVLPENFADLQTARQHASQTPEQLKQRFLEQSEINRQAMIKTIDAVVKVYRQWKQ